MRTNVNNYMDFVGVLVDIRKNFLGKKMNLTLTSGEGTVQVEAGREMAEILKVGNVYTIGYVNKNLISVRAGVCETARSNMYSFI